MSASTTHCVQSRGMNGEPRKKRVYTPLSSLCDGGGGVGGLDPRNAARGTVEGSHMMAEQAPTPTIHNIVSTSKIVCTQPSSSYFSEATTTSTTSTTHAINLEHIYEVVQCSHYNRRKFAAITIRVDDPTVTALLFTSGRLVITGSKSWYECMLASLVVVRMLREVQPECHFHVQVRYSRVFIIIFTPAPQATPWATRMPRPRMHT